MFLCLYVFYLIKKIVDLYIKANTKNKTKKIKYKQVGRTVNVTMNIFLNTNLKLQSSIENVFRNGGQDWNWLIVIIITFYQNYKLELPQHIKYIKPP